jgi:acyl-CoA thioesterase-1
MRFVLILALVAAMVSHAASVDGAPAGPPGRVLFVGNSITAGFGLSMEEAYPARIQEILDSLGLPYRAVNAGVSGETTSAGLRRIGWLLREKVAVVVIALGGNDGLRGIPSSLTARNLRGMIDTVHAKQPEARIVLAGMEAPPNMGPEYTSQFRGLFRTVAREKSATLVPFLLEGVGGVEELNLPDRIHPNAEGQAVIAATVWRYLEPLLRGKR